MSTFVHVLRSCAQWLWLALLAALALPVQAQPPGFTDNLYLGGWNQPVGLLFDNAGTLYVWEKGGRIHIVKDSIRRAAPLLDISEEVGNYADFGMLGFALDPGYLSNGYIYVMYIVDRHHLLNFGTPAYNPAVNQYNAATIGRITRYRVLNPSNPDLAAVDYASRLVLLGETKETGIPVVHLSHGVGSLVFGTDGTLLAITGDNASYNAQDTGGDVGGAYATQALADGIIRPEENVGAYRSQMLSSLDGKVLRLDPATGNGVPSNPFYDPAQPRAARSRVYALGLRNPCRMSLVPNTGSHYASDGNPGVFMIGDVGWYSAEELNVLSAPGQNFGWPGYEGNGAPTGYLAANPFNQEVPTPGGCAQPYYRFNDLLKQWNGGALPAFPDPCGGGNLNPLTYDLFVHSKPAVSWRGAATFASRDGVNYNVGYAGGEVPGPDFAGNAAIGGVWYTGDDYPASYKNTLFAADYGGQWIRRFKFNNNFEIDSIFNFSTGLGPVVSLATHPTKGGLYYVRVWDNQIRKFYYSPGNRAPRAVATPPVSYTAANSLLVNFSGTGSNDPDGDPIASYLWNFGDGSPTSNLASPAHTFTAPAGVPTTYTVTLTVTDPGGLSNSTTVRVSLNNTPPVIVSTSLDPVTQYSMAGPTNLPLNAVVTDAEHSPAQLTWAWQTVLHHDTHNHEEPVDNTPSTSTVINPIGCEDGVVYYYEIRLTVTDAAGLSATFSKYLYADCIPVAEPDAASYYNGQSVTVNVLANDHSADPINPASVAIATPPANGTALVNPDGSITYTHNGGGSNGDSFTYTVADTDGDASNPGTVTLTRLLPPTIVISSPASGASIPGSQATILYALSGNLTGVASVRFTVDGTTVSSDNSLDGSHLLTGLALGTRNVVAELLDAGGNAFAFAESQDQVSFNMVSLAGAFSHMMTIVIEEEQVYGTSNHVDFPVMFNLTQPELRTTANGGLLQNPNGFDIAFADALGNALDFQIEKYDPVTGNLIVWVRIPSLSPTVDTEVRLYYGNGSVSADPSVETTFSSCYQGRWHMNGNPAGAAPQLIDATPNTNNGLATGGMTAANRVAGIIGDATEFDGVDDYWALGGNVQPGANFTLSAWIRSNQADAGYHGFMGNDAGGVTNQRSPSMWVFNNTVLHFGFGTGTAWQAPLSPANVIANNNATWNYVVFTYNGTSYNLYTDGNLVYTSNAWAGSVPFASPVAYLGRVDNYFRGRMDESSVATCVRSQDWIRTEYSNINSPATFYTVNPGAPALTIVTPVENANIIGTVVGVTYARSGLQTGVTGVRFVLDGGAPQTDADLDGNFALTGLTPGAHTLTAVLLGAGGVPLGNPEATDAVNFTTSAASAGYQFSKILTVQEEYVFGTTPHTDFPVLVSFTDPDLRGTLYGGKMQNANGYDLLFTDMLGNALTFQVEKYNVQTGELVCWVKMPSLPTDVDTDFRMVYGNSAITSDPSSESTWKSCYLSRWHMNGNPAGAAPQLSDATLNTNNATAQGGMTAANRVAGIIGDATTFDGTDDSYSFPGIIPGNTFTLSAWISSGQTSGGAWNGFLGSGTGPVENRAPSLWVYNPGPGWTALHGGFGNGVSWASAWATPAGVIANNGTSWSYVVATFDGTIWRVYVNGLQVHTHTATGLPVNTPMTWIGRTDNFFRGRMDETSISNCVHSADWIRTEYNSQASPSTFVTVGSESSFPVEWLAFSAEAEGRAVRLRWTTGSERNNDYFTVERSADGQFFEALGEVEAAGNSDLPVSYQSLDAQPLTGLSYYRIRQTDLDGKTSWSKRVEVRFGPEGGVRAYPNPAQDRVYVETTLAVAPDAIALYTLQGQRLELPLSADPAGQRFELSTQRLPAGTYYLEVSQNGRKTRLPLMIQR